MAIASAKLTGYYIVQARLQITLFGTYTTKAGRGKRNSERFSDSKKWVAFRKVPGLRKSAVTCRTRAEAQAVLACATKILEQLGVIMNTDKTRIVHVRQGFEFLGYKIKRGSRRLRLSADRIKSGTRQGSLYAYPTQKSINRFKDRVRQSTHRRVPLRTEEIIQELLPIIRGWGLYYCRAHIRTLFHHLDGWIVRRLWSHRYKRWRCRGWKTLPDARLRGEMGLVSLVSLIPSLAARSYPPS